MEREVTRDNGMYSYEEQRMWLLENLLTQVCCILANKLIQF